VFDGVRVAQTGRFEKFLKVVPQLLHLALEVTLGSCDVLLVGVIRFLVAVIAGRDCDPLGVPLLPILATLGALPRALDSNFGRCASNADDGHFHIA
jgi:hypothetical protein